MEIKLKTSEVVKIYQGISKILENDIPVVLSFKLGIIKNRIAGDVNEYRKKESKIARPLSEPAMEKGILVSKIKLENEDEFNEAVEPLRNTEITINIDKIKLTELSILGKTNGEAICMMEPIIEEDIHELP